MKQKHTVQRSEVGFRPKRSGNMRRGPVPQMRATSILTILPGPGGTAETSLTTWRRRSRTPSGCTICWGTCTSGSRTCTGFTRPARRSIHPGPRAASLERYAAVRITAFTGAYACRAVTKKPVPKPVSMASGFDASGNDFSFVLMSAKLVSITMLLLLPALAEAQPSARCSGPLSEEQLTTLVKGSVVPDAPIKQNVTSCGIDFEATAEAIARLRSAGASEDRKSTRLNSSHLGISY